MKVLYVQTGKSPKVIDVYEDERGSYLSEMQRLVGGYIECVNVYAMSGAETDFVCNEEGKLLKMPLNRRLTMDLLTGNGEEHTLIDCIAGDFVVVQCDLEAGNWTDLSDTDIEYFTKKLDEKEIFIEPNTLDYEL